MQRSSRRALALCCVSVAFWVFSSGSALAATPLGQTVGSMSCSAETLFQTTSPGIQYAAPTPGVITSWSYQAPTEANITPIEFKAARPAGVNSFTIVGESERVTPTTPLAVNTFATQISVQAGDVIGLYLPSGGRCGVSNPDFAVHRILDGVDRPPGDVSTYTAVGNIQVNVAAILEPDCDGDGLGDESQDPSLLGGDCPVRGRTLTLDANKNKVKKGKKVRLSGQVTELARAGECQSAQTVQLQRKRPSQSTFTMLEQLQTDAAGVFSAKEKVKKTFEYRAQAPETATCDPGLSNTERVKVKKPK